MFAKKFIPGIFTVALFLIWSCSPAHKFRQDRQAFEAAAVVTKYKAVTDMNDAYFVIKENNFFEFYRELFDSVKNTSYPGTFTLQGDTMLLRFYNKKGKALLGSKAFINPRKKEIVFFDHAPGSKRKLIFN